jgi:hypothetical protein
MWRATQIKKEHFSRILGKQKTTYDQNNILFLLFQQHQGKLFRQ